MKCINFSKVATSFLPLSPYHAVCTPPGSSHAVALLNTRFGPACSWPGQASCRQPPFSFFPFHIAASFLELRTLSRLLLNLRHGTCFPMFCSALSLPGNRRARSNFLAHSTSISGGRSIKATALFQSIYSDTFPSQVNIL